MLDFVLWATFAMLTICAMVLLAIVGVVFLILIENINKRRAMYVALPDPDPRAERTFGQKYFERAIGRRNK
jgi:hypothetical protein